MVGQFTGSAPCATYYDVERRAHDVRGAWLKAIRRRSTMNRRESQRNRLVLWREVIARARDMREHARKTRNETRLIRYNAQMLIDDARRLRKSVAKQ